MQDHTKSERYFRTKYFLSKSGLLGITNKTAELLKKNKELQEELDIFKQQTNAFVQSVSSNPENQALMRQQQQQPSHPTSAMVPENEGSSDFTSILSGIYDFELPSVILAPAINLNDGNNYDDNCYNPETD